MKRLLVIISILNFYSIQGKEVDEVAFSSETDTLTFQAHEKKILSTASKSIGDELRKQANIFIRTSNIGGLQTVSAQGLNPQHVQVLWNDIPVNSGMLGVSDLSLFSIGYNQDVTYQVHGQEYVTGGLAGIVNIQDGFRKSEGGTLGLKQSVGSFGQSLTHLHHFAKKKRHSWSVSGGYERAKNNFKYLDYTVFPKRKKEQIHGDYSKWHIYPKWQVELKNNQQLNFYQEIISSTRNIPPFLVTPKNLATQKDFAARQMIQWKQTSTHASHLVKAYFGYANLHYEDYILNRQEDNKEFLSYLRHQNQWKLHPRWALTVGNDIKNTQIKTINYTSVISEWGWDAHTGLQFKPSTYSNIKALAKVTKRSHLPWYFPYQLEANAHIGKNKNWKIWAAHSMDARYPTLNDRYWKPGGHLDLRPERNMHWTAGNSGQVHLGKHTYWKHEVDVFYNKIRDMILWTPTNKGFFEPYNIGKILAYGVNTQQSIQWSKNTHDILLDLSYSWNKSGRTEKVSAKDKTQWKQLPYFPIHTGKMSLTYGWKDLQLAVDGQAYSERLVTRDGGNKLPAYAILNTSLAYTQKIKKADFEGRFSVNNLTGEQYEEVRYRPMPMRNFLFTLIISWNYDKN